MPWYKTTMYKKNKIYFCKTFRKKIYSYLFYYNQFHTIPKNVSFRLPIDYHKLEYEITKLTSDEYVTIVNRTPIIYKNNTIIKENNSYNRLKLIYSSLKLLQEDAIYEYNNQIPPIGKKYIISTYNTSPYLWIYYIILLLYCICTICKSSIISILLSIIFILLGILLHYL